MGSKIIKEKCKVNGSLSVVWKVRCALSVVVGDYSQ